jgi:hypothetical protein
MLWAMLLCAGDTSPAPKVSVHKIPHRPSFLFSEIIKNHFLQNALDYFKRCAILKTYQMVCFVTYRSFYGANTYQSATGDNRKENRESDL